MSTSTSAARPLGQILLMHLRDGMCDDTRALSAEAVATMRGDRIMREYSGETGNEVAQGYGMGWWIDRENPGGFADPGAYGAVPSLDLPRDYGAFIVIESNTGLGLMIRLASKPELERIFDEAPD